MSKIKNIYTFGTSFTEGGGFEFNKPEPKYCNHGLFKHYGHIDEPKTRENFSWPGQFQKLYNSIDVINEAKSGYGNERIYRRCFDIISHPSFNKDENVFIFEFSDVGRKEIFHKKINDYIILNYWWKNYPVDDDELQVSSFARTYYYDSQDITNIIDDDSEFLEGYIHKTIKFDEVINTLTRNMHMFLSFLNHNNIHYYIISSEFANFNLNLKTNLDFVNSKRISFELPNKKTYSDVMELFGEHKLSIMDETGGDITDGGHLGYFGNKLVARLIGNYFENNNIIGIENPNNLIIDYNLLVKK